MVELNTFQVKKQQQYLKHFVSEKGYGCRCELEI